MAAPELLTHLVPHQVQPYAELALIRHGESWQNANRRFIQGSGPDPANILTKVGEAQAATTAGTLLRLGILATAVRMSPLVRAHQTCDISTGTAGFENVFVVEDDRLREMCKGLAGLPGCLEGRRREEVETDEYFRQYRRWGWKFRHGSKESGGETAEEVGLRALAAMNDLADQLIRQPAPNGRPGWRPMGLVYAHGMAIRFGIGAALGWPRLEEVNRRFMLANGHGIIMRRVTRGGVWHVNGGIAPRLPASRP